MAEGIRLAGESLEAFERALTVMSAFRRIFGRNLEPSFIAELYAARELDLELCAGANYPGYDAVGPNGERYEIKYRDAQNVDVNGFDFDYLVLVNLDDAFRLTGMWRITVSQARDIFTPRPNFRKYQTTQARIKAVGERIR